MSEIRSQATPARDELVEKIQLWLTSADKIASAGYSHQKVRLCESMGFDWHETIAALQKALPRTVNSYVELDALPVGSVVRELEDAPSVFEKVAYEEGETGWEMPGDLHWYTPGEITLPATVLFTPRDAG